MKVSAYCLTYNHEKYIRSALDGFVGQKTDFDYEVFVHDDASTDGTAAIIAEYAEKYPHIIKPIYQTENQYSRGVRIMHEHILHRMSGEYIAVCEGDDYWSDPEKLQRQVDFLDSHPDYAACVHNTARLDLWKNKETLMFSRSGDEDISFEQVVSRGAAAYHTSSLMYRRKCADFWPPFYFRVKGFGDYPQSIHLRLCGNIRYINRPMSVYRFGTAGSWTTRTMANPAGRVKTLESVVDMLEEVNEYTEHKYDSAVRDAITQYKYKILYTQGSYAEMRKEPYLKLYRHEPLSNRIKMRLKEKLGGLYGLFRKIKYSGERYSSGK